MDISIPLKVDIDKDLFLKDNDLYNKEPVEIMKNIAYGDLPKFNDYLHDFIKENETQIIELIRYCIANEIGKSYLK